MSRWKYPFRTHEHAKKHLPHAEKETGKKCFIKKITYEAHIYKIFPSEEEYERYRKKKRASK